MLPLFLITIGKNHIICLNKCYSEGLLMRRRLNDILYSNSNFNKKIKLSPCGINPIRPLFCL
jgi:hypothetical protein